MELRVGVLGGGGYMSWRQILVPGTGRISVLGIFLIREQHFRKST